VSRKKYPPCPELAGILNINKPSNMTSHDVVAMVRRAARVRRVGHAGTLDPMATGVLLICLDQATRVSQYLMSTDKVYHARIRLGQTTDTDDREGQVIRQQPVPPGTSKAIIQEALTGFVGEIDQVPPRYAAIKRNGVRLYELARQGIDVNPPPRRVVVHAIHLLEWQSPDLTLKIHCGPGTYVRALARDLGERLGYGGHLIRLIRLKSGRFSLEEATELNKVVSCLQSTQKQDIADILWPVDAALTGMARMEIDVETETRLRQGQQTPGLPPGPDESQPARRRIYAADGTLVAIAKYDTHTELWQPDIVFNLCLPE
jgi:tRNA pseudouridine55 synthase